MANFGDPGFQVHAAMGQYLALLAFHLADDEVLPIDLPNYASELSAYLEDLSEYIESEGEELDLKELSDAIDVFAARADEVKALERLAVATNDTDLITVVNHKYRDFQRGFISQGGLPDREFYKHVVTAPGLDTGKHHLSLSSFQIPLRSNLAGFQGTLPCSSLASLRACNMATAT